MICTLISGCGLFRKKTKTVNREQIELAEESSSSVSLSGELKSAKQTLTQANKTNMTEETTTIEADEIHIDKDGNISAKGAKLSRNKRGKEKDNSKQLIRESAEAIITSRSDNSDKKKASIDVVDKSTKSDASSKGIVWGTIAFLGVVLFFLWYFGVKRKR